MTKKMENIYCPICDSIHDVAIAERTSTCDVKGLEIEYREFSYVCENTPEDNEFVSGKMMNENLLRAKDAYRKTQGLLTSDEIISVRQMYSLTQAELAALLGWGEVTITRYETKQIQDEAHNDILVLIKEDPQKAYDYLLKHTNKFSPERFSQLRKVFIDKITEYGIVQTSRKLLLERYSRHDIPSLNNGNKLLDIDKLEAIISYFASKTEHLFKVKLMKLLWYADMLFFREHSVSMTGLVYLHEQFGALPDGHKEILNLEGVITREQLINDGETVRIEIFPNPNVIYQFNDDEINVLDRVISKYKHLTGQRIANHMHEEDAYQRTRTNEIISYSWAQYLKDF